MSARTGIGTASPAHYGASGGAAHVRLEKQTRNSRVDGQRADRTTAPSARRDRATQSEALASQRSAGNAALARLLSPGAAGTSQGAVRGDLKEPILQRRRPDGLDRDKLATAKQRLAELEAEYASDKAAIVDALTPKGPVFNDALQYLHSMKLDYRIEAIASPDEFFREAQQLAREAIMSTKALDAFLRKLNGYDKSGGKNRIKSVLADLNRKLISQERDDLR